MRALLSIMALCLAACTAPYDKAEPDENNESESEVVEGIGPEVGEVDVSQPDLPKDTSAPEDTGDPVLATGFLENTDCGYDIGESACNFRLTDQNGNYWELDEHLGDLVLIDLSVMWCGPCKLAAETAQRTQDDYADQGFHYVTVLITDSQNDTLEQAEVADWANSFHILSAPVLLGSRDLLTTGGAPGYGFPATSWPTFILVSRSGDVAWGLYGFNESMIRTAIEDNL